jgi:competence protein ComEC
LEREFAAKFSLETAGVLDAALLGNRYNVSHPVAERLRAGGTFHVLVIAGLHIGFVAWLVFMFVRRITRRRLLQFVVAAGLVWAYVIAVGAHMPVVRAALMFTLIIFAPIVWRRANSLNVIGGAALVLLVMQPSDLFDPAFQLTLVSVLTIVLIAVPLLARMQSVGAWRPTTGAPYPPDCPRWFRRLSEALFWNDREWRVDMARSNISYKLFKAPIAAKLERWHVQRLLRYALAAIVVSASVQIGMLPLLIIYFHRLSFASIALNIFVGALMALLAFVALAAIVVSHLSPLAGSLLIAVAEKINWTMVHLVDPFTRLDVASIRLPHYSGMAAGLYGLYFIPLGFLIYALARWNPLRPVSISKVHDKVLSPIRLRIGAAAFAGLLALIVLHPLSAARPDGKLHIDFLDVGQGDSALLTMPDGTTLLIDGGGKPNTNRNADDVEVEDTFERDTRSIGEGVVSEYLWSRGMDRVDYILPTHADADHIDGLNDIAQNFKVRGAIVARSPADDPEYVRFATTMKTTGVPVETIGAGDILHLGNVTADVLWPPATTEINAPWQNNDGLVLRIRYGDHAFLFTGDIEKQTETAVLKEGVDLRSNVVKVAHHGSKTSSTDAFVAATHPSLAVISVGRTSMFGHPNKEVVERWRASGADVMTTGQRGTISVTTNGHTLMVSTFVR